MIGIVVLGTVVMDSGILLLALERWIVARRRAWSLLSPATMGRIGPLLAHITAVEDEIASLDLAIDVVLPERPGADDEQDEPTCSEAYTSVGTRLVALSSAHFHRPPSAALSRFVELSSHIGDDLDDNARHELLRNLDAVGAALRTDGRRLGPSSAQTAADLDEVNRELRRAVVTRLDSLRPLLVKGRRRRALHKRDRATLAEQLASAAKQLAAADALARTAPLASLRALAAVRLPAPPGHAHDAAFATGCRAVEAGLRVCAACGDACLSVQIAHCAAVIDAHLDRLHTAVVAETYEREHAHSGAFRSVLAAADPATLAQAQPTVAVSDHT